MTAAATRRVLLRSLAAGAFGAPALAACQRTGRTQGEPDEPAALEPPQDPTQPLVIGRIVSTVGLPGEFLPHIGAGLAEAEIAVNTSGGLFGQEVQLLQPIQMTEPGQDISTEIDELREKGAGAVVVAVPDDDFLAILPQLVKLHLAIISPTSTAGALRGEDARTAGLLFRLAPPARTLAAQRFEEASTSAQAGIAPGSIAVIGTDTFETTDLIRELEDVMAPQGGSLVLTHLYAGNAIGDPTGLARQVLEKKPALLMLEGGAEVGAVVNELSRIIAAEEIRFSIPVRLGVRATRDYSGKAFVEDALSSAEGWTPGTVPPLEHQLEMLNQSTGLASLDNPYGYSALAYDAVILLVLAARAASSVEGAAIARALPALVTGSAECADVGACLTAFRDQFALGESDGVSYQPRMGAIEFDENGDTARSEIMRATWAEDSSLVWGTATALQAPGT